MNSLIIFLIILPISTVISILWVRGISYMSENHPDYKGYDFLCFEGEDCEECDN